MKFFRFIWFCSILDFFYFSSNLPIFMKIAQLFLMIPICVLASCAHKPAVVSQPKSPWRRYDICKASGQYRFIDGITFALIAGGTPEGDLTYFEWMIVGDKPVKLEFEDSKPKIIAITKPSNETFQFDPAFKLAQEINPKDPVHEIPKGMKTEYDYDKQKLYYGETVQPFFGAQYFKRYSEVKNPRFTDSIVKGRYLSGEPKTGYLRYRMDWRYNVQGSANTELLVEIPPFKLNEKSIEGQRLRFVMDKRTNTEPMDLMHCNGSEPRGIWYHLLKLID